MVEIRFSIGGPGKVSVSDNLEDFEGVSQLGERTFQARVNVFE